MRTEKRMQGAWSMGHGAWSSGQWSVVSGQWSVGISQLPAASTQSFNPSILQLASTIINIAQ